MSRTLESVIDVAEATNPAIPLIPSIPETSVTQTHSGPIPSTYERNLFPPPPKALKTGLASKEKDFTLPIGQYMEVKRKMGGSDLPPISSKASAILAKGICKNIRFLPGEAVLFSSRKGVRFSSGKGVRFSSGKGIRFSM